MAEINVIVRDMDATNKADVQVPREMTGDDLMHEALQNFALPQDHSWTLWNATTNRQILPTETLAEDVVSDGHVLELRPQLVAGAL